MHGPAVKMKSVASEPVSLVAPPPISLLKRVRVYKLSFRTYSELMSHCCFQIYYA